MKHLSIFFSLLMLMAACSKKDTVTPVVAPTNLTLAAVASTDSSGNVTFTATATNAVSFEFDFGNGIYQNSTTGSVVYKYPSSGTYTVNVTAKSSGGKLFLKSVQVTVSVSFVLLWSDEFDVPGAPDPNKWGYDIGTGSGGWGNNEEEYYTNRLENSICEGGVLKIKAIKENYSGSAYTSARLLSKGKFSFKYGKVEARAKMPVGAGTWPAIWSLGDNISTVSWPACGEIDIMEHLGRDLNRIYGTLHYPGRSGGSANGATQVISNATTEFHTYGLEWNATTIKISVDGQVYHTVPINASLPFNQNFFLILNVAMGGNLVALLIRISPMLPWKLTISGFTDNSIAGIR